MTTWDGPDPMPLIKVRLDPNETALLLEGLDLLAIEVHDIDKLEDISRLRGRVLTPARKFGADWLHHHA